MGRYKQYRLDRNKVKLLSALVIVLIIAAIGTYLLVSSHAATPFTSTTAASGTLANGAASCPDTAASKGSSVVFQQSVPMDGTVALGLSCPGTPFTASSFWNTPLPASTPVNTNNAAYLNVIAYDICYAAPVTSAPPPTCSTTYHGGINTASYSAPLYVVPASQPLLSVTRGCAGIDTGTPTPSAVFNNAVAGGVPVPADAHAAAGTDEHIQIYQPSTNKYWEFWRFQKDTNGNWDACWGGLIDPVSGSDGIFPSDTGGTATSLPLLGGIPRIEELQAGQINHVMGLDLGNVASGDLASNVIPANTPGATSGVSWPATRTDGQSTYNLAIPEGLRFRLNPSLDLNTLDLTPLAKTIAVAAQKYGFVVDDSGPQPGAGIRVGDPTTYTAAGLPNPYTSGPGVGGVGNSGLFDGVTQGAILNNFPWNQLEALPFNYGEPSGT
jgi:hypothetical protein